MLTRKQLPLALAHADVAFDYGFSTAVGHFHVGDRDSSYWKEVEQLTGIHAPKVYTRRALIEVEGNVNADVELLAGGLVIVYGHVRAAIKVSDHTSIVIAGDLASNGRVVANDITHVFIGGALAGSIESGSSCTVWVEGDATGSVATGTPSMRLTVQRDFWAEVRVFDTPKLFTLQVNGFMPSAALEHIATLGYTVFNASVRTSDVSPGLYPAEHIRKKPTGGSSHNRWVVLQYRGNVDAEDCG